ncbi:unnamed protein product [Cylicocyclus nassatus]|uniref:Dienelactone hydrolase domain-containing protein n=1 Tax=Cylicocyclus nassatus TaxID=53992 RepID=A0AA36MDT0_CYLNA|nr:unnamed protein product [Cylicocyclus nassatus]
MVTKAQPLEYVDSQGTIFEGILYLPYNVSKKSSNHDHPVVLVLHAFGGRGEFECERAGELAEEGFVALAADVYGKGVRGSSFEENFALMKPLIEDRQGLLKSRLLAAVEAVRKVPQVNPYKVGAIGYCFGGLCALDLARHSVGLKAVVSFHGTLSPLPDTELTPISTSVQVHHGDADIHIKTPILEFMEEMRQREADWSFTSYGKAEHGFTEPHIGELGHKGVSYNKEADVRSWAAAIAFLKERLM